jgi:eukaryotic-like serine/threonine-protein kinase
VEKTYADCDGSQPSRIRFGPFELDVRAAELHKAGLKIRVQDQPFQILRMLLDRPGEVVLRDEIRDKLWPNGTIVEFDHSINAAVKRLRDALRDSAEKPRYIETLAKRGYRFIGTVEAEPRELEEAVAGGPSISAAPFENDIGAAEAVPEFPAESGDMRTPLGRARLLAVQVFARIVGTPKVAALAALVVFLVTASIVWLMRREAGRNWARLSVSRVEQLAATGRYQEAYGLALQVLRHVPAEPVVTRLMSELTDELWVSTTPLGAEVYLRRLGSAKTDRIGVTPIQHFTLARGEFILSIRKPGYVDFERTVSTALQRSMPVVRAPWEIRLKQKLHVSGSVPDAMVSAPGGEYNLRVNSRLTDATVRMGDYFIDKFEVSNRAFKTFVDAGGYAHREFWETHFFDAHAKPGASGILILKDKTGLPAPRGWVGGTFPAGKENYPVTGVTWHEASAYCRSRGKNLPTIFQWEKAARDRDRSAFGIVVPWGLLNASDVALRANFESAEPAAVDSYAFGMSPVGAYNMAGNVEEWIRNSYDDGFGAAGGAWTDPPYRFATFGPRPSLHSSETLGFRCAITADPAAGDQGGMPFASNEKVNRYPVSTEAEFEGLRAHYAYEKSSLNAIVGAVRETDQWRREEITFTGHGGERVTAFLYLPKSAAPPYQVIQYLAGTGWLLGIPFTDAVENTPRMAPYIRSGRAIFMVGLKGFAGRSPGAYAGLEQGSAEHREMMVNWTVDMQRGVDYLETRSDINPGKIVFWNDSSYNYASVIAAVERRYAAVILVSPGGYFESFGRLPPPVNPLRFAPHIRAPKLMLSGLYDDVTPRRTAVEPFFELLREPKKHANFDGGHIPPPEIAVPLINPWLDQTLGPVQRK